MIIPSRKYVNLTPPAAIIDDSAVTVAELDTLGFDYCEVVVILGATDIAMTVLKVTESDTAGSGHADVTGLIYGTSVDIAGDTSALPTALQDDGFFLFEIDLKGRKRYLDMGATVGDGAAGTFITIIAVLSRGEERPFTITDKGATGVLRV